MITPLVANKARPVLYCADCGKEFGEDPERRLGQQFICPVSAEHVAAVVKPPAGKLWLKIERRIARCAELSPMRAVGGGGRAGIYHLIRFAALLLLLYLAGICSYQLLKYLVASAAIFFLYDILIISTYATFVSRFPTHPLRTLILTVSSLFQIAVIYAIFYRLGESGFNQTLSFVNALYFSVVTISTVGYGDIQPKTDANGMKLLIISELVVGFSVVAGLFAVVTGWVNERPRGNDPITIAEMGLQTVSPDSPYRDTQLGSRT